MKIIINKEDFLDWKFADYEDRAEAMEHIIAELKDSNKVTLRMDDLYIGTGYIPSSLILNSKSIPNQRKSEVKYDYFEITPSREDKVKWK